MGFYQNHIVPHLVNLSMRNRELAPYRVRIIGLARGRVLEIGVGSGAEPAFVPSQRDRGSRPRTSSKTHEMAPQKVAARSNEANRGLGGINSS